MKIYRLEVFRNQLTMHDEAWRGPYDYSYHNESGLNDLVVELCGAHNDNHHPSPSQGGFWDWRKKKYRTGCSSLESLKSWFGSFLEKYLNTGKARIAVYEVPAHAIDYDDGQQVVFKIKEAKLLEMEKV